MKTIDLATWPRRSHYALFRKLAQPHFSLVFEVDVTHLIEEGKPRGVSINNAIMFAIAAAANAVPEFRTRFRGEEVIEHELVHPSVTVPIEGDRFAFAEIDFSDDWPAFDARCREVMAIAKRQSGLHEATAEQDHWLYMSAAPWFSFTGITQATNGVDDCIPRIAWGRVEEKGKGWRMPVGVQVHHALTDGIHIAKFRDGLEARLAASFV